MGKGGVRETVTDGVTGMLVATRPNTIAATLQRGLTDPSWAAQKSVSARIKATAQWSLPRSVDRIEAALRSVLALAYLET